MYLNSHRRQLQHTTGSTPQRLLWEDPCTLGSSTTQPTFSPVNRFAPGSLHSQVANLQGENSALHCRVAELEKENGELRMLLANNEQKETDVKDTLAKLMAQMNMNMK